jgi:PKD repeat protein
VTLQVQKIGATATGTLFQILGSHTYAEEGTFTVNINVTTLGGVTTALTPGTATVVDAALSSSNGPTITGIEGTTTGPVLLGSFRDANQAATVADFTAGGGSVVVNWGDGSAPETLAAANLVATGTPDGVVFTITAAHTYAEAGTFAYTVTVTDDGGSITIISGAAVIADAALTSSATQPTVSTTEAALFPVPVFAPPVFKGAVANFSDANLGATVADFSATIDWGDGTPMTAGVVSAAAAGGFVVTGSHTYADSDVNGGSGSFAIQVFVTDDDGSKLIVANTASVADRAITLTGMLNPFSDSGVSNSDDITNVTQPDFFGTSEPFSHVSLFATAMGGGPLVPIGQVQAGSDGAWNIASGVSLADGHYVITATAVDQFGVTTTTAPTVITANLFIDTKGPRITGVFFNRLNGQVDYTIQDPSPASGVYLASLLDSANYQLVFVHARKNFPGKFIVTNVTATPDPVTANAFDVAVTFNSGAILKGGFYVFTIRDSSAHKSSVRDIAGNHLDGEFYGSFPSGNGVNGGDFVAELQSVHNKVFAPQTIIGTASAANGGVGGATVGTIHSGAFVPAVPVGGAPIFSTSTSPSTPLPTGASAAHKVKKPAASHAKRVVIKTTSHAKPAAANHNHPKGPLHR